MRSEGAGGVKGEGIVIVVRMYGTREESSFNKIYVKTASRTELKVFSLLFRTNLLVYILHLHMCVGRGACVHICVCISMNVCRQESKP